MSKRFSCPEETLAGEIDWAITYLVACNPDQLLGLLLGRRTEFAGFIARMLTERAGHGHSGMRMEDTPAGNVPERVTRE